MSAPKGFEPIPGDEHMHGYRAEVNTRAGGKVVLEIAREYAGEWTVFVHLPDGVVTTSVDRVPFNEACKAARLTADLFRKAGA